MTNRMNIATTQIFKSPAGPLLVGEVNGCLCLCDWIESRNHSAKVKRIAHHLNANVEQGSSPTLAQALTQLHEYFAGLRTDFDIPMVMCGTDFQKDVWQQLMVLPYGGTDSYAHLAETIGRPTAIRAIANAIGANPISIFVPCHRIIGSNGSLTGYAGGLHAKQHLLNLEKGNA